MRDLSRLLAQPEWQCFGRKSLWSGSRAQNQPRNLREVSDEIASYVAAVSGSGYPDAAVEQMLLTPAHSGARHRHEHVDGTPNASTTRGWGVQTWTRSVLAVREPASRSSP